MPWLDDPHGTVVKHVDRNRVSAPDKQKPQSVRFRTHRCRRLRLRHLPQHAAILCVQLVIKKELDPLAMHKQEWVHGRGIPDDRCATSYRRTLDCAPEPSVVHAAAVAREEDNPRGIRLSRLVPAVGLKSGRSHETQPHRKSSAVWRSGCEAFVPTPVGERNGS